MKSLESFRLVEFHVCKGSARIFQSKILRQNCLIQCPTDSFKASSEIKQNVAVWISFLNSLVRTSNEPFGRRPAKEPPMLHRLFLKLKIPLNFPGKSKQRETASKLWIASEHAVERRRDDVVYLLSIRSFVLSGFPDRIKPHLLLHQLNRTLF